MSAPDHPNRGQGLPMVFPPWLDRLQMRYMNPAAKRLAPYLPTFAIVKHRGRKSGKPYETVVNAYRKGDVLAIALGHGKTDWVQNVLAADGADVHVFRRDVHITNPRILPPGTAGKDVQWAARLQGSRVGLLVADIA